LRQKLIKQQEEGQEQEESFITQVNPQQLSS